MEKTERSLGEYLTTLRRRKGSLLSAMTVILLITISLAFGLSPVYRASATILIEQQEIPQDLVRSVITSYADERIQLISQRVMTTANLRAIIEKYNLYPEMQTNEPMEAVIEQLRDDVHLETVNAEVRDPRSGGHKKPLSPLPWLTRIGFPSLPAMSLTKMMRSHFPRM